MPCIGLIVFAGGRDSDPVRLPRCVLLLPLLRVQVGVIQHLGAFLGVLSDAARLAYLPSIVEIRAETDNWRFRHLLAS